MGGREKGFIRVVFRNTFCSFMSVFYFGCRLGGLGIGLLKSRLFIS